MPISKERKTFNLRNAAIAAGLGVVGVFGYNTVQDHIEHNQRVATIEKYLGNGGHFVEGEVLLSGGPVSLRSFPKEANPDTNNEGGNIIGTIGADNDTQRLVVGSALQAKNGWWLVMQQGKGYEDASKLTIDDLADNGAWLHYGKIGENVDVQVHKKPISFDDEGQIHGIGGHYAMFSAVVDVQPAG